MRFVVDETSVQFTDLAPEIAIDHFEQLLDIIDDAIQQNYPTMYLADLFTKSVVEGKTLYDLYESNPDIHIPREIQERVAVIFGRLPKWDDAEDGLPPEFEVIIGDGPAIWAPSIAWAHHQALQNGDRRSACFVMQNRLPHGSQDVITQGQSLPIYFISSKSDYINFFRWIIEKTTSTPNDIENFAKSAFPEIAIIPGATNGIKTMSKPYGELIKSIVHHLSVFSDEGKEAFGTGSWQNAPALFGSKGVDISDENGNTKSNKQAEKERTKVIDGRSLIFWWHSKLERDRDRIHVYPDDIQNGGKLIIGIFCRHLT